MNQIEIANIVKNYLNDTDAEVDQFIIDSGDFLGNLFDLQKIDSTQTAVAGATTIDKPDNCAKIRRLKIGDDEIPEADFDDVGAAENADALRWYEDDDKIQLTEEIGTDSSGDTIMIWYDEVFNVPLLAQIGGYGTGNDQFAGPSNIYCDGTYLYIVDQGNNRIVKRLASTLAYVAQVTTFDGADTFNQPTGITGDGTSLYITDTENHRIVQLEALTLTYVGEIGTEGVGDDQFHHPRGIYCDGIYLYIADTMNHRIIVREASGFMPYWDQVGSNGAGNDQFDQPYGVTGDGTYIYVADTGNSRIVKRFGITFAGSLTYVSQIGSAGAGNDNFGAPRGVYYDENYIYVADTWNNRIVKRLASTLAYTAQIGSTGNVYERVFHPYGVCAYNNNIYIPDTNNHRITKRNVDFATLDTNIPDKLLDLIYIGATYRYFRKMLSIKVTIPATYADIEVDELRKVVDFWRTEFEKNLDILLKNK